MSNIPPNPRPARITGLRHVLAALGYSLAGLRRLRAESAFTHEAAALPVLAALLWLFGASTAAYFTLLGLFFLLIAVESLNTAIEVLVDHLSPDYSIFARDAKDLGSLAVMCVLAMHGLLLGYVMLFS